MGRTSIGRSRRQFNHHRKETMKYRRLGNAGVKLSEIGLGGWLTFGKTTGDPTRHGTDNTCRRGTPAVTDRTTGNTTDSSTRRRTNTGLGTLDHHRTHVFDHSVLNCLHAACFIARIGLSGQGRHAAGNSRQQTDKQQQYSTVFHNSNLQLV